MNAVEDTELVHHLGNLNLRDAQNPEDELEAATGDLDTEYVIDKMHSKLSGIDHVLDTLREVRNAKYKQFINFPLPFF